MRKLSEYENEEGIELLGDLIGPATKIFADKKVAKLFEKKSKKIEAIQYIMKNHSSPLVEILAILNGKKKEEYHENVVSMTAQCFELLNDEDLMSFFQSQGLMMGENSSGSATENITETETV